MHLNDDQLHSYPAARLMVSRFRWPYRLRDPSWRDGVSRVTTRAVLIFDGRFAVMAAFALQVSCCCCGSAARSQQTTSLALKSLLAPSSTERLYRRLDRVVHCIGGAGCSSRHGPLAPTAHRLAGSP